MGTSTNPATEAKKSSLTPKAIIFQKFGDTASYKVEEVQESSQNGCPGLVSRQKGPCLYRCCLQLPEFSVVSETFKRKKEAEQAAAKMAIEKLGIHQRENIPTTGEAWDDLIGRLSYFFSSEFLDSGQPLSGHFRAALKREGHLNGCVPISVIATYDSKLNNLCKYIDPEVESNPLLVMPIVQRAAAKLTGSLSSCEEQLSLRYMPEVLQSLSNYETSLPENIQIKAVRIPASVEEMVESLTLNISSYYLDVIAQELGVTEGSKVSISCTIGKASSEMRLFFCSPRHSSFCQSSKPIVDQDIQYEGSLNVRASYLACQAVYGDAILASIGYTWKSTDLFYEDVSLRSYYRILISKIPCGVYKLSRESILVAELPVAFTTRSNWKGSFPKEILCTFCRQHRLSEPVFSIQSNSLEASPTAQGLCKKLKVTESVKEDKIKEVPSSNVGESAGPSRTYKCEITILSKRQDLILQCSPKKAYKKQMYAMHNTALKILLWLNMFLRKPDISAEKLKSFAEELDIQFYREYFLKEFALCPSVHNCWQSLATAGGRVLDYSYMNVSGNRLENMVPSLSIGGQECGVNPSSGFLACVCYSVCLVSEGECVKEKLESNEELEFEIGCGAVVPFVEAIVTQMSVGQSASFLMELPPQEFIFAAADDFLTTSSLLSSRRCNLEYSITLLRVTEALEDRMEQALFSPPLSKQRVEYALQHIRESCALSLVDFGCGSGSLLDSLLQYPTSLEKIVGVDISKKGLTRAAKILHSKLDTNSEAKVPNNSINSAVLYEGSITNFDSRLYGFDIGTCLEVIEHMEEDEAYLFGDVVLRSFCPRILIVSTPNYEYNVILQKSSQQSQEEDPDEKNQQQSCKFRNHDHKFEWTRSQFCSWATDIATRHDYSVEFSGVGGKADVEPGFASQIAVFRRKHDTVKNSGLNNHYGVIWEWSKSSRSKSGFLTFLALFLKCCPKMTLFCGGLAVLALAYLWNVL